MSHEINSVEVVFNFKTIEAALKFLSSISSEKCTKEKITIKHPKEEIMQPQPERNTIKKPNKKYLTPAEIAEVYSLNVNTLANMRAQRKGPIFFKAGKKILYSIDAVEQWIISNKRITIDKHFKERR